MSEELAQAKHLVMKMAIHQIPGKKESHLSGQLTRAKKCALACIDIILDSVHPIGPMKDYWSKVKKHVIDGDI